MVNLLERALGALTIVALLVLVEVLVHTGVLKRALIPPPSVVASMRALPFRVTLPWSALRATRAARNCAFRLRSPSRWRTSKARKLPPSVGRLMATN